MKNGSEFWFVLLVTNKFERSSETLKFWQSFVNINNSKMRKRFVKSLQIIAWMAFRKPKIYIFSLWNSKLTFEYVNIHSALNRKYKMFCMSVTEFLITKLFVNFYGFYMLMNYIWTKRFFLSFLLL